MARSDNNLSAVFTDTANAIRSKTGGSNQICPRDFADEITNIPTGQAVPWLDEDYPDIPLPSKITEQEDVIYLLYDLNREYCCPAFSVTFTSCTCNVYFYKDKTLYSSTTESISSNTNKYLQYERNQNYNFALIKLSGIITKLEFIRPKYNDSNFGSDTDLGILVISGKCQSCTYLPRINSSPYSGKLQNLRYFAFSGLNGEGDGLFSSCGNLISIPELQFSSNLTTLASAFTSCYSLKHLVLFDTSKVTNWMYTFYQCFSLNKLPAFDMSKGTNFSQCFSNTRTINFENMNLESAGNVGAIFSNCSALIFVKINQNNHSFSDVTQMFYNCHSLQSVEIDVSNCSTGMSSILNNVSTITKLILKGLKVSFSISNQTKMTREALVEFFNNIATVETTQTLTLGSTLLNKLTAEDRAIATNKGWTLA